MISKIFIPIKVLILIIPGVIYSQEFKAPESVAFDYSGNRYFISNFESGDIIQIDSNGVKSYFKQELSKPLGMIILDSVLYLVENGNVLRGYNIFDGVEVMNLKIQGAKFLNDVTTDSLGSLYITDIGMNKVIKLNLNTWKYLTFVNTDYEAPNGILFEKSGERLIICYFSDKSAVQAISLEDTSITTLYSKDLINLDGIASDDNGNIYVSSWGPGSFSSGFKNKGLIYKFEKTFINLPELITTDHFGPADIFFNRKINCLIVPHLLDNTVDFFPIK